MTVASLARVRFQRVYEQARRYGLGHRQALEAASSGEVICWCGSTEPCPGGALRRVACPVVIEIIPWGKQP